MLFFGEEKLMIFGLVILQLHSEGCTFNPNEFNEIMLQIIDRAEIIANKLNRSKSLRREFEAMSDATIKQDTIK